MTPEQTQPQLPTKDIAKISGVVIVLLFMAAYFFYRAYVIVPNANAKLLEATDNNGEVGVKDALAAGADVNTHNYSGVTPLMLAALHNNLNIARTLQSAGANLDLADQEGWTALRKAVYQNNADVAEFLCNQGADVNLHPPDDTNSVIVLSLERSFGVPKLIPLLIAHQARITTVEKDELLKSLRGMTINNMTPEERAQRDAAEQAVAAVTSSDP